MAAGPHQEPLQINNDAGLKVYNSDPEVSFTQPTKGATFASGAAIQFVAGLHDDQTALEDLRLVWSLEDGSTLVGTETRTADGVAMVLESGLPSGEHTVTLVAVDSQSATGEDSVDISVVKNKPPTGEFLNPVENQLVAMEQPLRVELQVTDADEEDLAAVGLSWSGLAAGVAEAPAFADSSGKAVFYIGELPAGYQQISVQVTDSLGAVGNSVVSFEIRAGDTDGDGHTGQPFGGDDCNDDDATVYTGAPEHCDGRDEDCDGLVDEDAVDAAAWHPDLDQDNFGDGSQVVASCTQPPGHLSDATDCDDGDVAVNPSAAEVCDGIDNNCDGQVDESGSVGESFWYADGDGDSFGDIADVVSACAVPSGYVGDATDCDDSLATIYPGAPEHCDGVDEDCDGTVDNAAIDALSWYQDRDGDGFGNASQTSVSCTTPSGHVADATDCDDGLTTVNPAATEHCDGVDEDCDGQIDDAAVDATTWYLDADADGYGGASSSVVDCTLPQGYAATNTDCDDGDAAYHPNAPESSCTDPNDYNCDGSSGYADRDADGYAACEECDDGDATISPDGVEVCNGQDDDCNGTVDDAAADALSWYVDVDGDDHGTGTAVYACLAPVGHVELADDCDDAEALNYPGAPEYCDGADNDCDGTVDEADAVDVQTWYADADADGYGTAGLSQRACSAPAAYVADATDCDDADAGVHPGAAEYCDGEDDDCDGNVDEVDAVDVQTWYADGDGDGYGGLSATLIACNQPTGFVADGTDCEDSAADVHPNADEYCDGEDDDCNGSIDDDAVDALTWYADADADGYGSSLAILRACAALSGFVATGDDCNDADPGVYPGASEYCDGQDDDCDGTVDEDDAVDVHTWYADADADGYGTAARTDLHCTQPAGYVTSATDCDDGDAGVYPGALEYCDGEDDDCDGSVDEADAVDVQTWYADADQDGFGDAAYASSACTAPAGYVADALSWYTDADADGYGGSAQTSCTQPSGTVAISGDCNDGNAAISPAATEICDALNTDEDCDGLVEDADPSLDLSTQSTWYTDADSDGYGTGVATLRCEGGSNYASSSTDCNDGNAGISPGAAEICDSADTDEDCDGTGDEQGAVGCLNFYVDADGDGYGGVSYACLCSATGSYSASANDDCDDALLAVYPGAEEVSDGIDNDCDGTVDELGQEWTLSGNYTIDWFVQRTTAGAINHELGEFFASGKDVTGDGVPDLLLGDTNGNASGGGLVYLYQGPILRTVSSYVSTNGAASDYIGPVAMLDDQNGDSVAEVLIGGDGVGSRGGAYIISGAAWTSSGTVSTRAYVAISGSGSTTSAAGFVVAAAGDVFGDGTSDMIIGQTVNSYGRLHVEDGPISANKALAGTVSFTSPNLSDSFGDAIAAEGDLNGDGLADMVFGAYNAPSGGVVWVHYGAAGLSGAVTTGTGSDAIRTAAAATGDLGRSVDILPDLNNDGYDELAIGDSYLKAAYIEFGSPTSGTVVVSSSDIIISSTTAAGLGRSLSNAGDLNGDGQEDFAIGANAQLFVYYDVATAGSYDAETSAAVVVDSSNYATVGTHVGPAGDMDSDGIDDLMVPCPTLAYASSYGARTYLLSGGLSRVGVPAAGDTTLTGTNGSGAAAYDLGTSLAGGDFNDDGYGDLMSGDSTGNSYGNATLLLGPFAETERTAALDGTYSGGASGDAVGTALAGPGYINSDGFADYLVAAPYDDTSVGSNGGTVYIVTGATLGYSASFSTFTSLSGFASGDLFGYDVAIVGEADSDGYSEFVIGAPYHDVPTVDAGRVYYYSPPISASNQAADGILRGEATLDHFGWTVAGNGDVDADGYDDLIIGAPGNDDAGAASGKVYFYWGGALSGTYSATAADESVAGTYADDQLGQVVAAAGDMNQDGYDDVLMAGPSASEHVSTGGKVAFVHGPITNRTPMWWYGLATTDKAGVGLSAVEDSDLDGYPELAIGCSGCGLSRFGEVYIRKGAAENR